MITEIGFNTYVTEPQNEKIIAIFPTRWLSDTLRGTFSSPDFFA